MVKDGSTEENVMSVLSITQAREHLGDCANQIAYKGERICVERNGKPAFAMVTVEDMELLETIEDKIDIDAAREALRRNDFVAWKKAKKQLGL